MQLLVENGAHINAVNNDNNSALIHAADSADLSDTYTKIVGIDKMTRILIQNGADVNIVGNNGKTALMFAAEKGKKG